MKGKELKTLPKNVLTTKEAAEYLGIVSHRTLEELRQQGRGPEYVKVARKVGYRPSALDAYLESITMDPEEEGFVA